MVGAGLGFSQQIVQIGGDEFPARRRQLGLPTRPGLGREVRLDPLDQANQGFAVAPQAAEIGAERVVYGSGAPALRTMGGALRLLQVAGLGESDTQAILGGNTKRLLAAGGTVK